MDIWEMLGIAPTKDIAAIKKAYAARAKEYHPEEHPEEYQRIRSAYKLAVKYAKLPEPAMRQYEGPQLTVEETEKAAEQPREPQQEVPQPKELPFCYEEVDEYLLPKAVEQFCLAFDYISWNPYLINNPLVWSCLCSGSGYEELFANEVFRAGLAERICKIPMMRREAFEFWDHLFAGYGDQMENRREWERKRRSCARESLFRRAEHTVTREERDMHERILARMSEHQMNNRLKSRASVEGYLNYYLPYAVRNHREVEKQHRSGGRARIALNVFLVLAVLLLITAVVVNVYLYREERDEPKVPEERIEELRDYNDMIQDEERIRQRDKIWEDTIRTYEDWLGE